FVYTTPFQMPVTSLMSDTATGVIGPKLAQPTRVTANPTTKAVRTAPSDRRPARVTVAPPFRGYAFGRASPPRHYHHRRTTSHALRQRSLHGRRRRGGSGLLHDASRLHAHFEDTPGLCGHRAWRPAAPPEWADELGRPADAGRAAARSRRLEPHPPCRRRPRS